MGTIQHSVIVVTGCDREHVQPFYDAARKLFIGELAGLVSALAVSTVNDYWSFCIFPDGSKLGWETSEKAEVARDALTALLGSAARPPSWFHINYGELDTTVTGTNAEVTKGRGD